MELSARDGLKKRSEIVVNALGIIDVDSVEFDRGCITKLTCKEIEALCKSLVDLLNLV